MRLVSVELVLILLLTIWGGLVFSKKYFYVYDWPEYIDDVWPPMDGQLHEKSAYNHDFRANNGAGRILNSEFGLFQTWQFSLYR